MSERYEKLGASVRLESSSRGRSVITLREGGFAERTADGFSCGPLPADSSVQPPPASTTAAIDEYVTKASARLAVVERMALVEGRASHRFTSGSTSRTWEGASGRLFVTLVRQPCGRKAALSLGGESLEDLDASPVSTVCQALAFAESLAPSFAPALTLAPWVGASLVRAIADERLSPGQGLHLVQQPPHESYDGQGVLVTRKQVEGQREDWPECFRPSYRFEPTFTPLHVDLEGSKETERKNDFTVVAMASSWARRHDTLFARVWVIDRDATKVSFARIAVTPGEMKWSTVETHGSANWFPEGAGAWGRYLTLRQPAAQVRSA